MGRGAYFIELELELDAGNRFFPVLNMVSVNIIGYVFNWHGEGG
jgi:hypothetical protein